VIWWHAWAPVTTDCNGGPEVVVGYAVMVLAIWVTGWYDCGDPPVPCPQYAVSGWNEVAYYTETGAMLYAHDLGPTPAPPLGGVYVYRAFAEDLAGNLSCDGGP
jgi:hypothetical protein